MRTHKYRIWDKRHQAFVREDLYRLAPDGTLWIGDHPTIEPDRYHVQEYMDLQKAYEGDIVKIAGYSENQVYIVRFGWYDNGGSHEYYVGGYGWYLETQERTEPEDIVKLSGYGSLVVIGNIYENAELAPFANEQPPPGERGRLRVRTMTDTR